MMRTDGVSLLATLNHNRTRPTCLGEVIEKTNIRSRRAVKPRQHILRPKQIACEPSAPFFAPGDRLVTYGLSVALIVSALLLARWLDAHFVGAPVSVLLCAVMLSGWFGGLGPGLFASILAFLAFGNEFVVPIHSFTVSAA